MHRSPVTPGSTSSSGSRRSRLAAKLPGSSGGSRSRHSQRGNPFDDEYANPLEEIARWRLTANAMALRSGASFAFALGNRAAPAPPAPTQTIMLDSTLSAEWKDKEVIRVDVWEPNAASDTAPQTAIQESEDEMLKGDELTEEDEEGMESSEPVSRQISRQISRQTSRQPSRQSSRQLLRQLSRQPSREASKQLFRQLSRTTSSRHLPQPENGDEALAGASKAWEDARSRSGEPRPKRMALINFHGGGFVLGNGTDDARWAAAVMESHHAVVFSVNYRLAPGYPYPTPVEDCVDAILQIVARADDFHVDPDRLFLSGFSAGGTLALASWVVLQDPARWNYTLPSPAPSISGLALFYPLLDWTIPRAVKRQLSSHPDETLAPSMTNLFDASYLYPAIPRSGRDDPRLSPGLMSDAMLANLPPVHLCLCERDMLLNEGLKFSERLKEAGRTVTTRVVLGEKHAWDKPPPFGPPDSVAVEYQAAVVAMRHWDRRDSRAGTRRDVGTVSDATEMAPGITVGQYLDEEVARREEKGSSYGEDMEETQEGRAPVREFKKGRVEKEFRDREAEETRGRGREKDEDEATPMENGKAPFGEDEATPTENGADPRPEEATGRENLSLPVRERPKVDDGA